MGDFDIAEAYPDIRGGFRDSPRTWTCCRWNILDKNYEESAKKQLANKTLYT